ncbi:hypothetical protein SDC9_59181 [bioreactor metagenome]|uniref:Uncharacterized protein n=1 Tax=bioreactor metagenome TaxID=1076179 RepID=A0A644XA83_9ZZZZ
MTPAEKLQNLLDAPAFKRWFSTANFSENGVSFPTQFMANWVHSYFSSQLFVAFGFEPEISVYKRPAAPVIKNKDNVIQLDFWEDNKRGCANSLLRAALFPPLPRGKRQFLKNVKLESVGAADIIFTGEQFDQTDLDVYLEILNFARPFPLGTPVSFSARAMLKALGKGNGGGLHKWLHSVMIRLRGGTLDITDKKNRYFGGLVKEGVLEEATEFYTIIIDTNFAKLFGFGMWSKIDIEERRALKGASSGIAKALHAYYSTHAAPSLHSYETLSKILGLSSVDRQTKARMIEAHKKLEKIGFLHNFEAKENGIRVSKKESRAQRKHLVDKWVEADKKRRKKAAT